MKIAYKITQQTNPVSDVPYGFINAGKFKNHTHTYTHRCCFHTENTVMHPVSKGGFAPLSLEKGVAANQPLSTWGFISWPRPCCLSLLPSKP